LFETKRHEAENEGIDLRIWSYRDLQAYALDPYVIARLLGGEESEVTPAVVAARIDAIADTLRNDGRAHVLSLAALLGGRFDADRWVAQQWPSPDGRLSLIPGRLGVLRISAWANRRYGRRIGLRDLVAAFRSEDLHPEIRSVLVALAAGEPIAHTSGGKQGRRWPDAGADSAPARPEAEAVEVLDLFEAAGVFD
jgi:hypothetical protein